jgi:hypothetical protein
MLGSWFRPTPRNRGRWSGRAFRYRQMSIATDGQGTASISVEFENAYLELMWPDSTVAVEPGFERAAEKFHQRMRWRGSGWCPIGVGFRETSPVTPEFSYPTWSTHQEWLPAGSDIVILTPRDDTHSPSSFVTPRALTDPEKQAKLAGALSSSAWRSPDYRDSAFFTRDVQANSATRLSTETGPS